MWTMTPLQDFQVFTFIDRTEALTHSFPLRIAGRWL